MWQHPEDIPSFHQIAPDQARISKGTHWKTYALFIFGQPVADNCRAFGAGRPLRNQVDKASWF